MIIAFHTVRLPTWRIHAICMADVSKRKISESRIGKNVERVFHLGLVGGSQVSNRHIVTAFGTGLREQLGKDIPGQRRERHKRVG